MVEACARAKALGGGPSALGAALGVFSQAISNWTIVPPKHVLRIEKLTGVSRFELRPDIFGAADEIPFDLMTSARLALKSQALADAIKVPLAEMAAWEKVPPELVLKIERHSGVSRHLLRPDVFGPAPEPPGERAA